jgi:tetratricopeptide (TPR) repeat protein
VLSLAAASIGSSLVTGTLARRSAPAPVLASPTPASVSTPTPVASPVASPVAPKPAREVHDTKPEASPTIKDLVQAEALVTASNRKLGANDPTGALADADRAVELTPDSAKVYVNRGWIRRQTGNLPGALKDYDKAIELTPQYAMAWSNRSDAKRVTSDYTGAIADATQAISLAPSLPWPYLNRGLSKLELNDQSGIDDLEKFLIMEPTGPTADAVRKQLEKAR